MRMAVATVLAVLAIPALGRAPPAAAQAGPARAGGKIPVERDLRDLERSDRALGIGQGPGFDPNVTPHNPSGVPGFSGPPGIIGDTVGNSGPLPPGGPGNDQ